MPLDAQVLPNELIFGIIEYCATEDLPALCLVCSAVRTVAHPLLYRTVELSKKWQCDSFLLACTSTGAGAHTRSLSFGTLELSEVKAVLPCVPHITRLRTDALAHAPSVTQLFLGNTHSLAPWLLSEPLRAVTHLFLEDAYCIGKLGFARVAPLFPALTHAALASRALHGGHLAAAVRSWLEMPRVRRVVLCVVFSDPQQMTDGWPEMLDEMRKRVRDARAFVWPVEAHSVMPRTAGVDSVTRRTRMAADALGRDAFRGTFDLWNVGTCLGSPESSPEDTGDS